MLVSELMAQLAKLDPNLPVYIDSDSEQFSGVVLRLPKVAQGTDSYEYVISNLPE